MAKTERIASRNPFVADGSLPDTVAMVGAVLLALAALLEANEHEDEVQLSGTATYGLSLILRACNSALGEADE